MADRVLVYMTFFFLGYIIMSSIAMPAAIVMSSTYDLKLFENLPAAIAWVISVCSFLCCLIYYQ
jgi:hypothetical protein